jgi:hypothetical protein
MASSSAGSPSLTTRGAGALPPPELGVTERVRDFAARRIWRRWLWRAMRSLLPQATSEALHQARIAGKRLRYTLEFFADALGPTSSRRGAAGRPAGAPRRAGRRVAARAHVAALGLADDPGARSTAARETSAATCSALPTWGQVDSAPTGDSCSR